MGGGGGNTPYVMEAVCVQGNTIERADSAGANGVGAKSEIAYNLTKTDRHGVAYSLDRAAFNQGANAQYNISVQEEQAQTLVAKGPHAVAHPVAFEAYQHHGYRESDVAGTLTAGQNESVRGDTPLIAESPEYVVRRLMPIEASRLQGFPDWWLDGLETTSPTDSEIDWWLSVFETQRLIVDKAKKPKTRNAVKKFLQNPRADSSEYSMWGNSICLPIVYNIMSGIAEVLGKVCL